MTDELYDVLIIGGGPAGATAALYTSRAELKTVVLDKSTAAGALGITSKIANYPGVPEVLSGAELLERMWNQAKQYGAEFKKAKVVGCELTGNVKTLYTSEGDVYKGKAVIISTGAMGRGNVVPGENEFLGKGVSYCATCDAAFFRNQDVIVVGSNEEAVEEALFLTRFAKLVYIASPKPELKIEGNLSDEISINTKIKLLPSKRLKSIHGNGKVEEVILMGDKGEERIKVSGVFIYTQGSKPIVDFLQGNVNASGEGCIFVDKEMKTSIPGVFACGDVLCNDVKQAVIAAAEGCIAALSVDKYLNNRKNFVKDYS